MKWSWFDLAWPWIGLGIGAILFVFLFATQKLRGTTDGFRWRDPVWLAWLMSAVYFLHNFEEYGIDALGQAHAFPIATCSIQHLPPYPACPIPPGFYLAVNIAGVWIGSVLAALLCKKNKAVGLGYAGLLITNGLAHVGQFAASGAASGAQPAGGHTADRCGRDTLSTGSTHDALRHWCSPC